MYQFVVLGLSFLLLIGGGYYITRSDSDGVIRASLSKETQQVSNATTTNDSTSSENIIPEVSPSENNTDIYTQ